MTPRRPGLGRRSLGPSVQEAVARTRRALERAGIDEAGAVAEWAVAEAIGLGRAAVRAGVGDPLGSEAAARLAAMTRRLAAGEPFAYVAGWAPFRSARLAVDSRVLIPRPETEQLVDEVLRVAVPPGWRGEILDIGTGSGCIAIALALERPDARVLATDISADALAVAGENVRRHGVAGRVRLEQADLLGSAAPRSMDLVVSNPPYVSSGEMAALPTAVREWEPFIALDGGPDGLREIRRVIAAARCVLRPGGWLWMEIGENQGAATIRRLREAGFAAAGVRHDSAGYERFAWARPV